MQSRKLETKTEYHLWHYWKGDQWCGGGWVPTGVYHSLDALKKEIARMQQMGWTRFKAKKIEKTITDLSVTQIMKEGV